MDEEFYVQFESHVQPFCVGGEDLPRCRRLTYCKVWQGDAIIAESFSANAFRDQDCKFIGQKVALRNALENNKTLGKEDRRRIWKQFFLQSKKGRLLVGSMLKKFLDEA